MAGPMRISLFRGMDEAERAAAWDALRVREKDYKKGEIILLAGEPVEAMGLVLQGSVTVERIDAWGNRSILAYTGRGDYFGEYFAIEEGSILHINIRANEDCRIQFYRVRVLHELGPEGGLWAAKLVTNLLSIAMSKNLILFNRSFHTAPKTIRERLLSYLTSVSIQKHSREFDIPFDRQQLADYLNLERTALSKELGKMVKDGLIEFRKNHFRLLNTQDELY